MSNDRATRLMHQFGFNVADQGEAYCTCGWHWPMPRLVDETTAQLRLKAERQHALHLNNYLALNRPLENKS